MSARTAGGLVLGAEPRVQLLPPIVRQRAKLRETRRLLVLLIILSVVVVAGGVSFGVYQSARAQLEFAAIQAQTQDILAQQAEYAEGARVAGLVQVSKDAQLLVTSGEVDWVQLVGEVRSYLPGGADLHSVELAAPAPWEPQLVPEGPLRASRIATFQITVASSSYDLAALFASAVGDHAAVADVRIQSSTLDAGRYLTVVALTLDSDALATRFVEDAAGTSGEDGASGDITTPTPTPTATEGATP